MPESGFLGVPGSQVPVEVEAGFAHRDSPRSEFDDLLALGGPSGGMIRMKAHCGRNPAIEAIGELDGGSRRTSIHSRYDPPGDMRGSDQDRLGRLVDELQVAMRVDPRGLNGRVFVLRSLMARKPGPVGGEGYIPRIAALISRLAPCRVRCIVRMNTPITAAMNTETRIRKASPSSPPAV